MPSLADVANDLEGFLGDVKKNASKTNTEIAALNGEVNDLITVEEIGFANLSFGVAVLIDRVEEANCVLDENRRQNETIICWLTNIANVACEQLRSQLAQLEFQLSIDAHLRRLESIECLVHAREYVEVLESEATDARIDECCPRHTPDPKRCFEPCPSPGFTPFKHSDVTFRRLPQPGIGTKLRGGDR